MTELLPCPFCGGPAEVDYDEDRHHHEGRNEEHRWAICCSGSGKSCPVAPMTNCTTEAEAIKQWNTRSPPRSDSGITKE